MRQEKRVTFHVTQKKQTLNEIYLCDVDANIVGFYIDSSEPLTGNSNLEFKLDGKEIITKDFPIRIIQNGGAIPTQRRMTLCNIPSLNKKLSVTLFADFADNAATPAIVSFVVILEKNSNPIEIPLYDVKTIQIVNSGRKELFYRTNKDAKKLKSIIITKDNATGSNIFGNSSLSLIVENKEYIPMGFAARLISPENGTNLHYNVSYPIDLTVNSSEAKFEFNDDGNRSLYPYKLLLISKYIQ